LFPDCPHAPSPNPSAQVTLIDQSDRFVFKPLLYELVGNAASEEEVAPHYSRLLAPYPVTFVQGKVAAVTPELTTQVRGAGRALCHRAAGLMSAAAERGVLVGSPQMLATFLLTALAGPTEIT
jgi:hypothetical protein